MMVVFNVFHGRAGRDKHEKRGGFVRDVDLICMVCGGVVCEKIKRETSDDHRLAQRESERVRESTCDSH